MIWILFSICFLAFPCIYYFYFLILPFINFLESVFGCLLPPQMDPCQKLPAFKQSLNLPCNFFVDGPGSLSFSSKSVLSSDILEWRILLNLYLNLNDLWVSNAWPIYWCMFECRFLQKNESTFFLATYDDPKIMGGSGKGKDNWLNNWVFTSNAILAFVFGSRSFGRVSWPTSICLIVCMINCRSVVAIIAIYFPFSFS